MDKRIALIGAGNMARALIGGLIGRGHPRDRLVAADPSPDARAAIENDFEIAALDDNASAVAEADIVILAVKPQVIDRVVDSISHALGAETLVVSVAAGIPVARLQRGLGDDRAIVRVMPNTPALYGAGATGLYASPACGEQQKRDARAVFEAVGEVFEIADEALMDVVTAVSGSGPAYFFALAEALAAAGHAAGLDRDTAERLAAQTGHGAGTMLGADEAAAGELRERVTSPGGTTAAALDAMGQAGFERIIAEAVNAAVRRGRELGEG